MLGSSFAKSSYSAYNGSCAEAAWHKSSFSGGGNCVEFRKSSHSNYASSCVETADGCGQVHVRDSKDPAGPVLSFSPAAWAAFTAAVKKGGLLV